LNKDLLYKSATPMKLRKEKMFVPKNCTALILKLFQFPNVVTTLVPL